jgi:hypothetical protein
VGYTEIVWRLRELRPESGDMQAFVARGTAPISNAALDNGPPRRGKVRVRRLRGQEVHGELGGQRLI